MLTDSFEVIDQRFRALVIGNVHVEKLFTGCRWAEGPAYFPAGRYLVWSDIPNNRIMRWDETDGSVSVFREPADHSNGNTRDRQGRLVTCHHLARAVVRTEHDGSRTVLASHYQGKRLNSPNDLVEKSDGSIWFTDPSYGIDLDYEGKATVSEIGACHVYRIDPRSGAVDAVATDFEKPNGIAFSPDEKLLYIADTGFSHGDQFPRHIRVFDVGLDGKSLAGGRVFASSEVGMFDGMRIDVHGNVWTSSGDGVRCYAPDGTLIGRVRIPEVVANCCFGGPKRNRLFICGTTSLYSVFLNVSGAPPA
jgi:gluconolactonase